MDGKEITAGKGNKQFCWCFIQFVHYFKSMIYGDAIPLSLRKEVKTAIYRKVEVKMTKLKLSGLLIIICDVG